MLNLLNEYLQSPELQKRIYLDDKSLNCSDYQVKLNSDTMMIELSNDKEFKYINLNAVKEIKLLKSNPASIMNTL